MHQRDATTEHFGKALYEIFFNQVTPVKIFELQKVQRKDLRIIRKVKSTFLRDYKLDLFSPTDQKPREARIALAT